MADRIRFHLDESVDPDIALALRRHGIDVTTTAEVRLRGQPDEVQIDYARRERRVIVTHDADFLRFAARSTDHCGIAYCRMAARSIRETVRSLILIYEVLTPQEIAGKVQFL